MNIVKFGGSIVNPDGRYDDAIIDEFIDVVRNSDQRFIFVVGGGKICRLLQDACEPFTQDALHDTKWVDEARDAIGIATTKINARYVLRRFKDALGDEVHPEIILDPSCQIESDSRVFFTGGWKPGHSTDKDMMLLALAYKAKKVYKISNFAYVKKISPGELARIGESEKEMVLAQAETLTQMSWQELKDLVGDEWNGGLNTPFDPQATDLGVENPSITVCIGTKEAFLDSVAGKEFKGTVVQG